MFNNTDLDLGHIDLSSNSEVCCDIRYTHSKFGVKRILNLLSGNKKLTPARPPAKQHPHYSYLVTWLKVVLLVTIIVIIQGKKKVLIYNNYENKRTGIMTKETIYHVKVKNIHTTNKILNGITEN